MIRIVPKLNHGLRPAVFVAKHAQARGAQQEVFAGGRLQSEPTCGQDAQYVAAGENENVALNLTDAFYNSVSACTDLLR